MKFLMMVLAIHFVGEMISNKMKARAEEYKNESNANAMHPAEFQLRKEYV